MGDKQTFETTLRGFPGMSGTCISVPFDAEHIFGSKRVPVVVTINGAARRTTICRMDGEYTIPIPRAFRDEAGIAAGDNIVVTVERDTAPRVVEVPDDLNDALASADVRAAWDRLSYTHKKEHVLAVEDAKRPETRIRRIEKCIQMLTAAHTS